MNVKVLFNNDFDGWGLSLLIDQRILFDTGESPAVPRYAAGHLGLKPSALESVVLSHDHWDHVGGIEYIIEKNKKIKIYICPNFDAAFKNRLLCFSKKVIKADHFQRVCSNIYTTGQLTGFYKEKVIAEQALILQTGNGFSVVTGCAHPGIINTLKRVRSQLSLSGFYAVIGGFHLKTKSFEQIQNVVENFKALKVKYVAPLHCTGDEAIRAFQDAYQDHCHMLKTGDLMEV